MSSTELATQVQRRHHSLFLSGAAPKRGSSPCFDAAGRVVACVAAATEATHSRLVPRMCIEAIQRMGSLVSNLPGSSVFCWNSAFPRCVEVQSSLLDVKHYPGWKQVSANEHLVRNHRLARCKFSRLWDGVEGSNTAGNG